MRKKVFALALAAALTFGTTVPVLATATDSSIPTTESTVEPPEFRSLIKF
jgi:hypothetical protein